MDWEVVGFSSSFNNFDFLSLAKNFNFCPLFLQLKIMMVSHNFEVIPYILTELYSVPNKVTLKKSVWRLNPRSLEIGFYCMKCFILKTQMTFLMSCRRDKPPHCHCHSPASSKEWARRPMCIRLWSRGVGATACFSAEASGCSSQKQSSLCWLFTLYAVWNECKNSTVGIYLSVPVWLLLPDPCWPREEMGHALYGELSSADMAVSVR